jgi:hypothetical protein
MSLRILIEHPCLRFLFMGHTNDLMYQPKAEKQAAPLHHIAVAAACLNVNPNVSM